jgi:hypothetical protein
VILLIAAYFALVLVLPLSLSAAVSYRSLPFGRSCPQCGGESLLLQARIIRMLSRVLPRRLEQRWCPACEWTGAVKVSRAMPAPPIRLSTTSTFTSDRAPAVARTVDVRWLTVDGIQWRVRLEYWNQSGLCFGRLVFVEPSGRLWLDIQPFRGRSDREVLNQALALSNHLLVSRLREVVSD